MKPITDLLANIGARLNWGHDYLSPLLLRMLLAWEYFESGITKWRGDNWFTQIQDKFPFPFSVVPANLSWSLATVFEIGGAIALLLGLFTRFFAFSLIVLTAVATAAVHWPAEWNSLGELWMKGYDVADSSGGNFKLPLLFIAMLLPLVLGGAGRISVDRLICRMTGCEEGLGKRGGLESLALQLAILGIIFVFVMPIPGFVLFGLAIAAAVVARLTESDTKAAPHFGD